MHTFDNDLNVDEPENVSHKEMQTVFNFALYYLFKVLFRTIHVFCRVKCVFPFSFDYQNKVYILIAKHKIYVTEKLKILCRIRFYNCFYFNLSGHN